MDLRQRLAKLDRLTRRGAEAVPRTESTTLITGDDCGRNAGLAELGLRCVDTGAGAVWCCEYRDPMGALPACLPDLRGFFSRDDEHRPRPADLLLIDTETTGLAGGTGTLAFLVGVAWWDGADLVTRQFFLAGPAREAPLLAALSEVAAERKVLLTFNGHSFDLPLLRTRALLNRMPDPLRHLVGWDLLVPARRLWGRRLPNCRQQTLEELVCGRHRGGGDIDGARIPQTWFDFLTAGTLDPLRAVLVHNRRDMIGMADLFRRIVDVAGEMKDIGAARPRTDWRDAWALGRLAERRRQHRAAVAWLTAAVVDAGGSREAWRQRTFVMDAVRILKRGRDWSLVERVIGAGLNDGHGDPWLHREAAKLYEHRLARFAEAERHAQLAGDRRREERLRKRLARERTGPEGTRT